MLRRPLRRLRNWLRGNITAIFGVFVVFATVGSFSVSFQSIGWNVGDGQQADGGWSTTITLLPAVSPPPPSTTIWHRNGSMQIQSQAETTKSPRQQHDRTQHYRYRQGEFCSGCRFVHLSPATNVTNATCQVLYRVERQQNKRSPSHAARIVHTDFPSVCARCISGKCPTKPAGVTCQWLILLERRKNPELTLLEAAHIVAAEFPDFCYRCNPQACPDHEKIYWRLDETAPAERGAWTHYLRSIPPRHRIPPNMLDNLHEYAADDKKVYPNTVHLFEFNPSIVQLPASQIPADLPAAAYLASFRVSFAHNCIRNESIYVRLIGGARPRPKYPEYLGMALLDADLTILRQCVLHGPTIIAELEDVRLVVLQHQIYISTINKILPLWIVPPKNLPAALYTKVLAHNWPKFRNPDIDHSLQVTFRRMQSCTKDIQTQVYAKNLNYFVDADNRTILETLPMGPKEVIDLQAPCIKTEPGSNLSADLFIPRPATLPRPSFGTLDELHFLEENMIKQPYARDSGSSCCVSVQHPTANDGRGHRDLLLGISHRKTYHRPRNNHYVSSFYVMENTAPYRVVARTGGFCLGFSKPNEAGGGNNNPYWQMMQSDTLQLGENYTNCPRIHFISGMVRSVKDPSQLIIAYGIEDCVPRMVLVDLADVMNMLFAPQKKLQV